MQPLSHIVDSTSELKFSILHSIAEFDQLKDEWSSLLERSDATVFQTFEWQRTWWKCFGESNARVQLSIIVVRNDERLVAIAPLFIERLSLFGFVGLSRLGFIAREISDYLNFICERGCEKEATSAFTSAFASLKNQFDVLLLEDIPNDSPFHQLLFDELTKQRFVGDHFTNMQSPRTDLKETWEATLESFGKKHRKEVAYELRNINRNFAVEFESTIAANDVQRNIEEFIAMHQERWTIAGHTGVFRDTRQADFHRAVARPCFEHGWLFLVFLKLNGKRVAVNYGFLFRETLSTYLNGMIELGEMSKYSPGKVLHELSMQEGIARGARVYDFMRGRERYKYALNARDVPNWTLVMYTDGSSLAKIKFKLHLLLASSQRRSRKELTMLRHVASVHGWLSRSTLDHLRSRIRQNTLDTVSKVKEPEKALPENDA